MKKSVSFLIFFLLMIQTLSVLAGSQLNIKTNSQTYSSKDKVFFEVTNSGGSPKDFYVLSAEQLEGKEWVYSRIDVACSCRKLCKSKLMTVNPTESIQKKWDQKTSECETALPGTYRIVVLGPWDVKAKKQRYQAISNSFMIQ